MGTDNDGRRPRWAHFATLSTRLTVLYAGLFAAILVTIALVTQVIVSDYVETSVRRELVSSSSVFERVWALRAQSLGDAADVLSHDFGFRDAVASGNVPTIESALLNLRHRLGVANAFVVEQDGSVVAAASSGSPDLRALVAAAPYKLATDRREAVMVGGRDAYRIVVAPILAPTEIGWVVFAVKLDRTEMAALERLSPIPLTATILRRDASGHWVPSGDAPVGASGALDSFVASPAARTDTPGPLRFDGKQTIALAKPLPGAAAGNDTVLLISYPLAAAFAAYRTLQASFLVMAMIGLALVLWGSRRLAGRIAGPLVALDTAARALEEGDRTEVQVVGEDEIGRLASSFNRMSAGILERENRITHLAFHDTLTDLPNRTLFRQQLQSMLARAGRRGETVAVLCLDLDRFKAVNDTLGHPVGDALLKAVGALIAELATDGIVARLSGDEFAIILAHDTDPDRPRALSQAIVDRLREPISTDGHMIPIAASIGIAVSPGDGRDASTLLKNADLALYRAKQDGRGVFRFFEPSLDAAARRRRQIELDLREAMRSGQLRLDYQPIFDLKTDAISGFEALMRWEHPERGPIHPVEFIPVAEDTGLIVAMGEWVIHEACREAMRWPETLRIAVNVSPLQFRNSGFSNIVVQALGRSGLAPHRLEIEITESIFLEGTAATLDILHGLRALGVRIALDDFGTGYSSLSYLRSFPFDKIKIDRSFVTSVAQDDGAAAIVRAIVALATAFDMETTAEGVEDEGQLAELRSQGCSSIQGFLFSRPIRAADVFAMVGALAPASERTHDVPVFHMAAPKHRFEPVARHAER